jgi:3-deoxy-7-phosphoheptulonate synthase
MTLTFNDRRINQTLPLMTPAELKRTLPLLPQHAEVVAQGRQTIIDILDGKDERALVIQGRVRRMPLKLALNMRKN